MWARIGDGLRWLLWLFASFMAAFAALAVALNITQNYPVILFAAICLGGMLGGLTLALEGGGKLGLTMPGAGHDSQPFTPGFLGDVFVGLMAALVMFGVGAGGVDLKPFTFDPKNQEILAVWLRNFAFAYLSGFLGLHLIKQLSKTVLDKAQLAEKLEDVGKTKTDTAYLLGQQALDAKQYDAAENYMRQALEVEGHKNIRSYIGMAQVMRRKGQLGQAISMLNEAIGRRTEEKMKSRVAVAYFNRACYLTLCADTPPSADQLIKILADIRECLKLEPTFAVDAKDDEDFVKIANLQQFKDLLKEYGVS